MTQLNLRIREKYEQKGYGTSKTGLLEAKWLVITGMRVSI